MSVQHELRNSFVFNTLSLPFPKCPQQHKLLFLATCSTSGLPGPWDIFCNMYITQDSIAITINSPIHYAALQHILSYSICQPINWRKHHLCGQNISLPEGLWLERGGTGGVCRMMVSLQEDSRTVTSSSRMRRGAWRKKVLSGLRNTELHSGNNKNIIIFTEKMKQDWWQAGGETSFYSEVIILENLYSFKPYFSHVQ